MAIYQTTAEVTREIPIPPILERRYTGEEVVGVEKNLINRITEAWGTLIYPDIGIISPSVEYPQIEPLKEKGGLVLPERLTNPQYGSAELEQNLRKLAEKTPGIEKVWKITKDLPSLTDLLSEERDNE